MDDSLATARKGTELLAQRSDSQSISTDLVCLNFKVPLRVRQKFKICAAQHNVTMTELLLRLLDDILVLDAQGQSGAHTQIEK